MTPTSENLLIGINVGKAGKADRGITVYTRNILNGFKQSNDSEFVLLHYPGSVPEDKFGIKQARLSAIGYSDKYKPLPTIFNEQIINPLQQNALNLDVVWHPHNRCQFFSPGVAYVVTMHDILPIARPDLANQYIDSSEKKLLYESRTMSVTKADAVITTSYFSRDEIVKHTDTDPRKIKVIYSGIDRQIFKPNRDHDSFRELQNKYALPDKYILTTGSYAPHKNLKTLVDSYYNSDLPKNKVGLVMAGPNSATGYKIGYNQLAEHVQRLNIGDKVRLLPSISTDDQVVLYSNAMMFVTTSLYEGFGFTPLEAMACETPVIASNTASTPEICGPAALYADPNNPNDFSTQFNRLLDDPQLRDELINLGRIQVSKFQWQAAANQTLTALHNSYNK